jgi:hypothetical protein
MRKLKFLFWNVNKLNLPEIIARIALLHRVDILILAESGAKVGRLLEELNHIEPDYFFTADSLCQKLDIFTRFRADFLRCRRDGKSYTIRSLSLPGYNDVIVAAAHLPSRLHFGVESINVECETLSSTIKHEEENAGHDRTIFVGDLNINPFDDGMVKTTGFHATMSRQIARKTSRIVQDSKYPFFIIQCGDISATLKTSPPERITIQRRSMLIFNGIYSIRFWSDLRCLIHLTPNRLVFSNLTV